MTEKKELNEELKNVAGGSGKSGYCYGIEFISKAGVGSNYLDGPFASLEIANAKLEEKKNELIEDGCVIKNTQVFYVKL